MHLFIVVLFACIMVDNMLGQTPNRCGSSLSLDLIFILDSSGSVYDSRNDGDPEYTNWQSELDFAKAIVNGSLPRDTKVATINFSGCAASYDFEGCKKQGALKKMWGLTDFGIPNNQEDVYNRFAAMDGSDFNGGYTWTNEALQIALNEFNGNSSDDRSKMIIILTDGEPYPIEVDPNTGEKIPFHEPCIAATGYTSPTLAALTALDVTIVAIGIDVSQSTIDDFFTCVVEDFENRFFYATDFDALKGLVSAIGDIVCNADIVLIINEVGLIRDYGVNGEDLYFIELYNPSVAVSLSGFRFEGMINYAIPEEGYGIATHVAQGQYWVISTYDMDNIDQSVTGCRNCSQDLLVSNIYADTRMNNEYWKLTLYNGAGEVVDFVERRRVFFPIVSDLFTHELISGDLDNSFGGNWEESCYVYGTPQSPNQEHCPCRDDKCISKGNNGAYCSDGDNGVCICSNDYILSGGVCVPLYSPDCCYAFKENCIEDIILLEWCSPKTSAVESYRIYKNGELFMTVATTITAIRLNGSSCVQGVTKYAVTGIFQFAPLLESPKTFCSLRHPSKRDRNILKAAAARNVENKFDDFEVIKDVGGNSYMTVSIYTLTIIFVIILLIISISYYCYYQKCILKKNKKSVRREVFHGLEINAHSDDESVYSSNNQQYVD